MNFAEPFGCATPCESREATVQNLEREGWSTVGSRNAARAADSSLVARAISTLNRPPLHEDDVSRPPEQATLCTPPSSCTLANLNEESDVLVRPPVVRSQGEQGAVTLQSAIASTGNSFQGAGATVRQFGWDLALDQLSETVLSSASYRTATIAPSTCEPVVVQQQPLPTPYLSDFLASSRDQNPIASIPAYNPDTLPTSFFPLVKLEEPCFQSNALAVWNTTHGSFGFGPQSVGHVSPSSAANIAATSVTTTRTTGTWCEDWCSVIDFTGTAGEFPSPSPNKVVMGALFGSQLPVLHPQGSAMQPLQHIPPLDRYDEAPTALTEAPHTAPLNSFHCTSLDNRSNASCFQSTMHESTTTTSTSISTTSSAQTERSSFGTRDISKHKRTTHTASSSLKCYHPGCGKLFSSMHNLNEHRQVHVYPRVRTYRCGIDGCNNLYFYKRDMQRHRRKKHNVQSYSQTKVNKTKDTQKRNKILRCGNETPCTGSKRLNGV